MSDLGKLARALLNGSSAPAAPEGSLSSLAARLRSGAPAASKEARAPLAETNTAVPQATPNGAAARAVASSHGVPAAPPVRLTDLASRLRAHAPQAPSPRISDLAARLMAPREEFVRLPLAGGYMAWPDVGTRVRWTEETRVRHGKVYRHGTVELSGRVTRVDTTRPNDIDVWAAPDGGQERRVGIAGIRVPATDVPRFVERAKARHAADLERNLREMRERDRVRKATQDLFDEGAAETASIVSFLREQAQEQPQTKTGIKIGSLLRACATTIERRRPRENEIAPDASRAAVEHLRSVAAKTSGKPGEALYVAAKAIESGRHLMKLTPAANGTVTSSSAPSTRPPSPSEERRVSDEPKKPNAATPELHVPGGTAPHRPASSPAPRPAPTHAQTPAPKGVFDFVVAREEGNTWTVTLKVLVRRQPQAGRPPTPAKDVSRPWRVVTNDNGSERQQTFWEQSDARTAFEREARERWAAVARANRMASPPPAGPVPPDPATLTSVAALRRIAPGTRLRKQGALATWDDGLRIFVAVETAPDRLVLRFDDSSPKRAGEVIKTSLDKVSVVPVSEGGLPNSFRIIFPNGLGSEQYSFEDWKGPASMTPWREALARRQEGRAATERADLARWVREELAQAQDDIDEAKSPRERARAEVRYADVAAVQRAASFRGVDPVRLARLIERARSEDDDILEDMLAAQEAGAFGAPSGQVGLFGSRAAWDPKERPLTARFDEAQRHAMLSRAPKTIEEYLLAAWGNAEALRRGERPEDNFKLGMERSKEVGRLLNHEPAGSQRYRDAERELVNLRDALLSSHEVIAVSRTGESIDAGSPITAEDAIEDDGDQARAGAKPTKPIVPSTRPKPSGPPAHWSPVERPLTARLTHDERDAARLRAPVTVEDHLVRAWDALAAVHRGEERDANLAYAQWSLSAAAAGVPEIPVHSQREKAEDEVGALRIALSAAQGIDIDTPPALEEPATPSGTPITDDEEVARYYALQPEPVAPSRLVYIYAPSNPQHQQNIEAVAALREAVGADRLPLLRARAAVRAGHYTARSAAEALRIRDALRRADVVAELAEDEELKQRRMSSEAGTAPDAIPASSKPIVPAAAPTAGIPAPTKPIVPAAAPTGAIPAPTKPIVPARVEPPSTRTPVDTGAAHASSSSGKEQRPSAPHVSRAPRWYEIVRFTIPENVFENLPNDALRALRRDSKSLGIEWTPPNEARPAYHTAPMPARSYPAVAQALAKVPSWSTDDATAEYVFGATKASADYDGFGTLQLTQLPNGHRIVAIRRDHHNWQVQRYLSSGVAGFKPLTWAEIENMPPPTEAPADEEKEEPRAAAPRDIATVARQTGRLVHVVVGDARAPATPDRGAPKTRNQAPVSEAPAPDEEDAEDAPEPSMVERASPVEHRTAAARRDANIKAMELAAELEAHPRPLTEEDRRTLLEYSDWGGVGIGKWADSFPPGFPVPEKRQLIHAYFTPPAVCAEIARIVKPLLPGLMSTDGKVHALEPSAGIGRFPLALSGPGFEALAWHCVEFSTVSYKMLRLLRPDIDLFHGPFERWIAERAEDFAGRLKLVISNPPYGQRNQALTEDPDRSYRYDRADSYFLRRGLDLLGAGGLGIYIIPSGFLTGTTEDARKLREEVLLRHHLAAAFRLPNEVFSLANVVTDILIFRARGAILSEVDDADRFVLEGRYYEEFPSHILGQIVQNEPGKRGWHSTGEGYTVVGEFTAIPPFEERPICASCQHLPAPGPVEPPPTPQTAEASKADQIIDRDERMAAAVGLGRRVEAFLASVANPDHEPLGWDELHHDLTEWAATHGAPAKDKDIIALAKAERGPLGRGEPGGAGWLLKAFLGVSATLIPPLAERPRWAPRFLGDANDPLQVGDYLYRTRKKLRIDDLPGKDPSALFAAGWCEDSLSPAWTERLDVRGELFPPDEYLYGELWPKFDRADARGRLGDVQAAAQARRLLELIQPATFDEIEISPQDGFVPLDLLSTWLATLNHGEAVHLVRDKGLVHLADVAYEDHGRGLLDLSQEALLCLGWINHDYVVFQPYAGKDENIDEIRLGYAKDWSERFRAFCEADPERQRAIERSYQRARQGYRAHGYGSEPLKLLRWNPAIVLNPHQIAGARRLDANRGGGLAFDVGVGKTFTILAALALARQQGRARRPVIVVPQPIALQWVDNIGKALPDFRVVVIGLNKKTLSRGLRKGLETSETDTPEERSRKWARFQGGEFDVAIVTYESLPRSKMDQESMLRFIEGVTAIEREVEIKRRNAKMQQKQSEESYREKKQSLEAKLTRAKADVEVRLGVRKQKAQEKQRKLEAKLKELEEKHAKRRLTERQEAILEEGVGAWLAEMLELPEGWKHDPDIVWQKLGITWIAFDEAHNGKNLHMPSSREGGSVPKFMGNEGEGSHRAWHWYFRCCDVQSRGGEVLLATATPASNSPLEFYNLVKLIDDKAWTRIGIHDPEAFIDRFCLLEPEEVVNAEMETETRMACVGFKNLDELRSVVMQLWEFKTAKQAGLKLPTPRIQREFVDMDAAQEKKYQQYVEEIEQALAHPKEGSHKILGLLQRMASVAQHAQLDEKFEWSDAHLVSSPHSPKYDALAKRVLALRGCGHIVFSDYVPAHAWIRDVLVEAGIPAHRIGILNAVVAPTAADRQRTAREFNGSETVAPKYDVLIANTIGEEGVDLQRRACAIHHMDIGWTPKKFDQRNGRGYRQGNTLSNIEIIYYIANRSQDGTRLDMVRGKQNWISSLLEAEGKEVNNPAAQSTLTRKELLVLISRDPEKTRARLEAAEAEREEERKKKVAAAASGTLRAVANRFDRARTETNATVAAEHLSVARQKLAGLAKVDPAIWPWMAWAQEAERHPMLVPKEGGPVYEGLRVAMPRLLDRSMIDYAEFGRVDGSTIGTRVAGTAHWDETSLDKVVQLRLAPEMRIAEGSAGTWPADDQAGIDRAMTEKWLPRLRSGSGTNDAWSELGWTRGPNGFVERQWARWGAEIVRAMESTGGWAANLRVPVVTRERLVFGLRSPHGEVIPPTLAGWRRFVELAPASGEKFSALEDVGRWWFGRTIPRNLLSAAREDAPASSAVSAAPLSPAKVGHAAEEQHQ